jgi:branched-chain amino acid transport system ATP-binding protein
MIPLLDVQRATVRYGHLPALREVSLEVGRGELVTVVGPNGAGKSTLLKALMGVLEFAEGKVTFSGEPLAGTRTVDRIRRGLCLVPEGRMIIGSLSVRDNLFLGGIAKNWHGAAAKDLENVYKLFPVLRERQDQFAGSLSGGQQQMLAIGRALLARPRLLLLDEPSLGLAPLLVESLFDTFKQLNQDGLTILLVEQNARAALALAHRAYVLVAGQLVYAGDPLDLAQSRRLERLYMRQGLRMQAEEGIVQ